MKWQMADWFFVVIFLAFVAMHFVGHGRHGAHRGEGERTEDCRVPKERSMNGMDRS